MLGRAWCVSGPHDDLIMICKEQSTLQEMALGPKKVETLRGRNDSLLQEVSNAKEQLLAGKHSPELSAPNLRDFLLTIAIAIFTPRQQIIARFFRVDPSERSCDCVLRLASASACDCFLRLKDTKFK